MAESERRYVADRIAGDTPAVLDTLYDPAPVVATYRNDDHARAVADNLNLRAEVNRLRSRLADVEQERDDLREDLKATEDERDRWQAMRDLECEELRARAERAEAALRTLLAFGETLLASDNEDERGIGWCICEGARIVASVPSSLDAPKEQNDE